LLEGTILAIIGETTGGAKTNGKELCIRLKGSMSDHSENSWWRSPKFIQSPELIQVPQSRRTDMSEGNESRFSEQAYICIAIVH